MNACDVSVIIVSWNTKNLLKDCINSVIKETTKYSYDIWVVDNNSPDNSADMVGKEFPDVNLIANSDNKGFSAANNQALRVAAGKNLLLLNPDTLIKDNAIDKMLDYIYSHNVGIVTCKLLNTDGSLQKSVSGFYSLWKTFIDNRLVAEILQNVKLSKAKIYSAWDHNSLREIDWARGAVLLFSREVMNKIGLLDERYFIYGEEIDFYYRARKNNIKAVFLPDVEIIHHGKSSSRQKKSEMFIQNYKSLYIFLKKNYPFYSYYIYRIRVVFYCIIWILRFSIGSLIKKILRKDSTGDITQLRIYLKTFIWHFSKESLIY
ncbi:MAG: glycosyltransferase family 2 protein [Ignavibacteria bacterium]